jgi:hypothetical protein
MNFQLAIVILLFVGALYYVGKVIYNSVSAKKGCGSNCKCGVDFSKIDQLKTGK